LEALWLINVLSKSGDQHVGVILSRLFWSLQHCIGTPMRPLRLHRLKLEGSHQMRLYGYIPYDIICWPGLENESAVMQGVVVQL